MEVGSSSLVVRSCVVGEARRRHRAVTASELALMSVAVFVALGAKKPRTDSKLLN
jgi:hypothetical protein